MATIIEGQLSAAPYKFGIVISRFNEFITHRLLDGAIDCLTRHGAKEKSIDVVQCPGAFEIPQVAQQLVKSGNYDAVICLGCVIRGETPHFDYIANAVSAGLNRLALNSSVPIVFGVLTTDSLDQAIERAGAKSGNKGWESALAAIELADVFSKISSKKK
jgi:6,7-dimethyl-8-ribityllumazine synthase